MNHTAGHGAGDGIPDTGFEPRRLIGDDEQVLAVIALKILGPVGRQAKGEVIIAPEPKFGRVYLRKRKLRARRHPTDLRPELRFDLAEGWRSSQDDAVRIAHQPPQHRVRQGKGLADAMTGFDGGAPVLLNRAQDFAIACPQHRLQNLGREAHGILEQPEDILSLVDDLVFLSPSLVAGVDVGGGEAETVVYLCASKRGQHKIIKMGAYRSADPRGEVVKFLAPYRSRLRTVRVDEIGIGYNFGWHLRDERFPIEPINVSRSCQSRPEWGENDPARRFANQKAQFYQALADALEHDQIDGLTDDETIGQLGDIKYEIDSHGRMTIEPKEKARERGMRSSDRAEALMLALGAPPSSDKIILVQLNPVGALSQPIERNERAPYETGFVERPYTDEDELPRNLRRVQNRRFPPGAW